MKYCSKCGAEMVDEAVVCVQCGCAENVVQPPAAKLKTGRDLVKTILLTIVTFGIYALVLFYKMSEEINITASKYDGKKTMNYLLMFFIIGPITFGIGTLVWFNNFSGRIGAELRRRNINYQFGSSAFWLWCILGALILVGPFVYIHKVTKAVNLINEDYNEKG